MAEKITDIDLLVSQFKELDTIDNEEMDKELKELKTEAKAILEEITSILLGFGQIKKKLLLAKNKLIPDPSIEPSIDGIEIIFFFKEDTQKWRFVKKDFFLKEIIAKFPIKGIDYDGGIDHACFDNWIGTINEYKATYMYDQFFSYFDSINMARDFLTTTFSKGPIKAETKQFNYADTDFIQKKCRQFYKDSIIDCSVQ